MRELITSQHQLSEGIDDILRNVNWDKIHKTMLYLGWDWNGVGVPTIDMLKERTKNQLIDNIYRAFEEDDDVSMECGGIYTKVEFIDNKINLIFKFILNSWDYEI